MGDEDEKDGNRGSGVLGVVTACFGMAMLYVMAFVMAFFFGVGAGLFVLGYRMVAGG